MVDPGCNPRPFGDLLHHNLIPLYHIGAPVAQWVKRWPTNLAVLDSSPVRVGNIFSRRRGSIAIMTQILLKRA